jgi:hypothetical protein
MNEEELEAVSGEDQLEDDGQSFTSEAEDLAQDGEVQAEGTDKSSKRIKDQQAEITRLQQERAEFREKMARLEGVVETLSKGKEQSRQQEDPFSFLDSEDFQQEVLNSPDKALPRAMKAIIERTGDALIYQEKKFREEIERLKSDMNRPSQSVMQKIKELKADPDYGTLDDKALAVIAKKQLAAAGTGRQAREFPGSPPKGGGRVAAKVDSNPEFEKEVSRIFNSIYGEG